MPTLGYFVADWFARLLCGCGVDWVLFGCCDCFGFAGFVVHSACDLGGYVVRFACVACVVFDVVCVVWFGCG